MLVRLLPRVSVSGHVGRHLFSKHQVILIEGGGSNAEATSFFGQAILDSTTDWRCSVWLTGHLFATSSNLDVCSLVNAPVRRITRSKRSLLPAPLGAAILSCRS